MAGEGGFDVKITVTGGRDLLSRITAGTYEMALLIWSGRADPDANVRCGSACDGFINWGKYLRRQARRHLAPRAPVDQCAERKRLYAESAAIYLPAGRISFLYHLNGSGREREAVRHRAASRRHHPPEGLRLGN